MQQADIPESDVLEGFPHPRERSELIGHEQAERTFLDACRGGRLHHAWIIGGPKGIGKATLAYRMARYVLKYPDGGPDEPDSLSVAEDDVVARRVAALGHGDLLVLRRPWDPKARQFKTTLPVDEVRRATRFFGHTSGAGGWRVCVVDAMDDMNANAANALLKILEEPPPKALFLLVCHVPGRLLPTIRSRCRRLDVSPLETDDAVRVMSGLLGPEMTASQEDLALAARVARGSVGQGLRLMQSGGLDLYRQLIALMASLPALDVKAVHAVADKLSPRAAMSDYALFMQMITDWLATMVRSVGTAEAEFSDNAECEIMQRLANPHDLVRWADAWDEISRSIARANALNLDRKQTILNVFFRLEETARAASAA